MEGIQMINKGKKKKLKGWNLWGDYEWFPKIKRTGSQEYVTIENSTTIVHNNKI